MGQLRLPDEVEAGFRLQDIDAFGNTFAINVYGAGRRGWFVASRRFCGHNQDVGPRPLGKGEWRTLLNLLKQCRFWELPEAWPHPPPNETVHDGEWMTLTGRETERYHRIWRFVWREPGLDQLLLYFRRLSGFFVPPQPLATIQSIEETAPPAEDSA